MRVSTHGLLGERRLASAPMQSMFEAAAIGAPEIGSYAVLYLAVAVSWVGIPAVGGIALGSAGALAGKGELSLGAVIAIGTAAAWTGGCLGYLLGARAGESLAGQPGRWRHQRRRALELGERFYRRWGPVAVFVTPTWVSGALRMQRRSFLAWNALAAAGSTLVTVFGAYAVARAIVGQLSARGEFIALAVAAAAVSFVAATVWRHFARSSRAAGRTPPRTPDTP